jgi:hypothetical protein
MAIISENVLAAVFVLGGVYLVYRSLQRTTMGYEDGPWRKYHQSPTSSTGLFKNSKNMPSTFPRGRH